MSSITSHFPQDMFGDEWDLASTNVAVVTGGQYTSGIVVLNHRDEMIAISVRLFLLRNSMILYFLLPCNK